MKTFPITAFEKYKAHLKLKGKDNNLVNCDERYFNWGVYDHEIWADIIDVNLRRANLLIEGNDSLPDYPIEQPALFNAQLDHHIEPNQMVAVISAFPLMLLEYYGSQASWLPY